MIEKINEHYSFTAPATIFNEEALTTLELSARTASKVNECVEAFNNLFKDVTKDLEGQDEKLAELNKYMSNFIGRGIPVEEAGAWTLLMAITERYVNEGKFAETYDAFADYIKGLLNVERRRIDTLLSGSTPSDEAEVIDLRVDCKGRVWESAGSSIRNSLHTIFEHLESFSKPHTIDIEADDETVGALWQDTGEIRTGFGNSKFYKVNAGEHYLVNARYGYSFPDVIFSSSSRKPDGEDGLNIIAIGNKNPTGYSTNSFAQVLRVPEGADQMWVQWVEDGADINLIKAKRVEGYKLDFKELEDFITTSLYPLESLKPSYTLCENEGVNEGYILRKGEGVLINNIVVESGDPSYKTNTFIVKAGNRIKFDCCANNGNVFYFVHNSETGEIFTYEQSENVASKQIIEREMIIPIGYDRITIADVTADPECNKVVGLTGGAPFSGLVCFTIGDSITEINNTAEKNYLHHLYEKTGMSFHNFAHSGAGFLAQRENNKHYFYQLVDAPANHPDLVLVMGSGNDLKYMVNNLGTLDSKDINTLYGQMYQTYNFAMSKYDGKARVAFVAPVAWKNYPPSREGNIMEEYVEAMRKFCRKYCIPFLDLYHEGGLDPSCSSHYKYFDAEGVHPNTDGHKIITSPIYNFLLGVIGAGV